MEPCSFVYILASARNGTLYTGVTSHLAQRAWRHREDALEGFTRKYGVKRLVWWERHVSVIDAIAREKAIKRWRRAWKIALIEADNPLWRDRYEEVI